VTLVDTSLVFSRLQLAAGFTEDQARSLKGVYDLAITLYNLPAAFMVPLTSSVIPAISACRARSDKAGAGRIAESSLRMASLIARRR
jgi:stage V sporulation protein B